MAISTTSSFSFPVVDPESGLMERVLVEMEKGVKPK
jgi:hypothetical protein